MKIMRDVSDVAGYTHSAEIQFEVTPSFTVEIHMIVKEDGTKFDCPISRASLEEINEECLMAWDDEVFA